MYTSSSTHPSHVHCQTNQQERSPNRSWAASASVWAGRLGHWEPPILGTLSSAWGRTTVLIPLIGDPITCHQFNEPLSPISRVRKKPPKPQPLPFLIQFSPRGYSHPLFPPASLPSFSPAPFTRLVHSTATCEGNRAWMLCLQGKISSLVSSRRSNCHLVQPASIPLSFTGASELLLRADRG